MLNISLKLADRCFLLLSAQTGCRTLRFLQPGWWDWPGLVCGVWWSRGRPFPPAPQEAATPSLAQSVPGWKLRPPNHNDHKTRCTVAAEAVSMTPGVQTFSWDGEGQQVYGFILLSCWEQATAHCKYMHEHMCVCFVCEECCLKRQERRVTPTVPVTAHQLCPGPQRDSGMVE